jgi:hypothetical protein
MGNFNQKSFENWMQVCTLYPVAENVKRVFIATNKAWNEIVSELTTIEKSDNVRFTNTPITKYWRNQIDEAEEIIIPLFANIRDKGIIEKLRYAKNQNKLITKF